MNILFCGDHNAEDGILIATLSLLKNSGAQELHIYIIANMSTHFTPYAMLRLFADEIPQLPNKILYLDADVIVRRSLVSFYQQDLTGTEFVGVLDYWGRFFFHNLHEHKVLDYVNSGVLLLNLPEIRKTNLFARVRHLLQTRTVLMPDQTALNRYAREKKIAPRRYNEQYKLQPDTVIQHFTTSFRFWPVFHTLTVKPWDVQRVHKVLKLHEYDDILTNYLNVKSNLIKK